MNARTALYRHFDADGKLLYVGISLSAVHRLQQHKRDARWSDSIASVTVEYHPSRMAALQAEKESIKRERPKWNKVHNAANDNCATKDRIEIRRRRDAGSMLEKATQIFYQVCDDEVGRDYYDLAATFRDHDDLKPWRRGGWSPLSAGEILDELLVRQVAWIDEENRVRCVM